MNAGSVLLKGPVRAERSVGVSLLLTSRKVTGVDGVTFGIGGGLAFAL
jgi:hypothetical protein